VIMGLGFGLRVWGIGFGLPGYTRYHPDEHALVERAARILWTGEWNLQRFNYPPLYAYLQTGAYAVYFLVGAAKGQWSQILPFTLPQYYEVGRLVTSILGTLTLLLLYFVGRQLRGKRVGLLAAALLGGCYLHVIHSHYATFDVALGLLLLATLLFSELLRTEKRTRWYLLSGLCAGLAGATKYNGAVGVVMPLVAHALATRWGAWGWLNWRLVVGVGGFLLGFFGGNPFALGNLPDFLNGLATVLHHYGTEQPAFEGAGNWRWYIGVFLKSADGLWVVAGGLGLIGWLWRDWKKGLLLAVFPATYYLMVSGFVVRFERNMVPILPFLALGGAYSLVAGARWLAARVKRLNLRSSALMALGAGLLLAAPLMAGLSFDRSVSLTDHREEAGHWLEANVEPGSKVAIEHYSIPFDHSAYEVSNVLRISDHGLAWYQEDEYDVLVISDGVWELLLRQPDTYAEKVERYRSLVDESELLAEFVPRRPGLAVAGYPTVAIYHFAPVRILRVPR
jgi:4-amino-4-deoxy-L-arabinose transferase-like glycosyltransferase